MQDLFSDVPGGIDEDVVYVLAGEDGKHALVEVEDGHVGPAVAVDQLVVEDADDQVVALRLRALQRRDVPRVKHVPRAIDVDHLRALRPDSRWVGEELDEVGGLPGRKHPIFFPG